MFNKLLDRVRIASGAKPRVHVAEEAKYQEMVEIGAQYGMMCNSAAWKHLKEQLEARREKLRDKFEEMSCKDEVFWVTKGELRMIRLVLAIPADTMDNGVEAAQYLGRLEKQRRSHE